MVEVRFLSPDAVPACPWCGRSGPGDPARLAAAVTRWGWCGVELLQGKVPLACLLVSPSSQPQDRVAELRQLWVAPGSGRQGLGRRQVQTVAGALLGKDIRALAARTSWRRSDCESPPAGFLSDVGFHRTSLTRWQLDLDQTVTADDPLPWLVRRLTWFARPLPPPAPAGRSGQAFRS